MIQPEGAYPITSLTQSKPNLHIPPNHLLTLLTEHACHHNSFCGSRCDSNHAPTISLKPVHVHGDFGIPFRQTTQVLSRHTSSLTSDHPCYFDLFRPYFLQNCHISAYPKQNKLFQASNTNILKTNQSVKMFSTMITVIHKESSFNDEPTKILFIYLYLFKVDIMESFNRGEHVVAAFLDVEKAFDNVWHNGLRYKIFMLDLPTKMTHWLSDFPVGRVIQVNVNGFLSDKISPITGVPQGSVLSPLLFLIYVNYLPKPHHRQNSKSQFADDTALWAASINVRFAAKRLQKDLRKLAKWCAKWRIKPNPEKTKAIIFSRSYRTTKIKTPSKTVQRET